LGEAVVYFAITAAPDGSRPSISSKNDFLLLVTVPDPPAPAYRTTPLPTR